MFNKEKDQPKEGKEIRIKKLIIKIGQHEVSVTPDEAKELKHALDEMFGKEVVKEIHHDWWYRGPYYVPVPTYPTHPWIVYTSTGTASNTIQCANTNLGMGASNAITVYASAE